MAWSTVIICAAHRLGTKESEREITSEGAGGKKGKQREEKRQEAEVIRMALVLIFSKCALTGELCW